MGLVDKFQFDKGTAHTAFYDIDNAPIVDRGAFLNAFRLNINPWFYQGWVKKPWQIKTP